ncbi:uncharacterized protein LOC126967720 [Leptidea sinapis]|uniref:uncharacterized protein LOC126967720 n=1 Tax=Leptidea sinapis TaxID=189913 RepID=UPI002124CFDC|nr:uncharacterized protein LOC126967720 [Leptidea sinapis]
MSDAELILRTLLNRVLDERGYVPRNVKVEEVSSDGSNYTTKLFTIRVDSPEHVHLNLFAKVATLIGNLRERMGADWLYDTERFVYTELSELYEHLQDKFDVPAEDRFNFPKFYGYSAERGEETIIMENLTNAGYVSLGRFESMEWEHAASAMDTLAKLHALSFAYAKYYPERFEKEAAGREYLVGGGGDPHDESTKLLWEKMMSGAVAAVKDDQKQRLTDFLLSSTDFKKYNKPNGGPVLVHGDYRLSNVLFKKVGGKLKSIVVDFQTLHAANPAVDIIYFVFLGSDELFREKYYHQLLDHYYTRLCSALQRFQLDPLEVYSREKFDEDIQITLPYAVLLGVTVLPVVTVEAASAPQLAGDADIDNIIVSPNQLYQARFSGIVDDLIRLGAL